MILHEILIGDQAGTYLPFAKSKLRALEDLNPKGWFSQTFIIDDYQVRIAQEPPFQYIRITQSGGVSYEFFTSEHVSDTGFGTPGHINGIADTWVCGSATRARFGTGGQRNYTATPLSSSALTPPAGAKWSALGCETPLGPTSGLFTWPAWQNQRFFEHHWHPNNDGKSLVTSCQAQAPGLANQANWMSPYNFVRVPSAGSKVADFGPDVYPTVYSGPALTRGAPQLEEGWINWRHAAVQTVGSRQFFVSSDNYGRFQVYPVQDYTATNDLVPPGQYVTITPPYPAWVSIPDPTDYTRQVNTWLWRFNKDATQCVSVPFSADFSSGFSKSLYNLQFFATLTPSRAALVDPSVASAIVPAHEDIPGLVEFGITITVTGTDPMDFAADFTLLRSSYFSTDGRFIFDAGYFMPDVEKTGIAEGTLLTAEVQCLYPAGYFVSNSGETPPLYLDLAPNVQGSIVINTNDASLVPTQVFSFPTFSGLNAKFATVDGYGGGFGPGPIGGYVTYTIGGSTYTGSAGPLVYTPPDPPFTAGSWGGTLGYLYALELSTLSLLYEVDDEVAGTGFLAAVAYGTEFYRDSYNLGYSKSARPWPIADTVMASPRWYQYLLDTTLNTEWGQGFNVHPAGHWALELNAELGTNTTLAAALDWISVKNTDKSRSRFTHKQVFNSAFGQTRDYSFYTASYPGELFWDQGSFRTQGIWDTFR